MDRQINIENILSAIRELEQLIENIKTQKDDLTISRIDIDLAKEKTRLIYNELIRMEMTVPDKKQESTVKAVIHDPVEENPVVKNETPETVPENKKESIADIIARQEKVEDFATKLQQKPISDINEAIGLGEKLLFINDLFDKDPVRYVDTIKELNSYSDYEDATAYIKANFNWDPEKETTVNFLEIVRRKFS